MKGPSLPNALGGLIGYGIEERFTITNPIRKPVETPHFHRLNITLKNIMSMKIIAPLTGPERGFMIAPLSQKTKDGIAVLEFLGASRFNAAFFCAKTSQFFIMSGWVRQPQGWPVSRSRYCNLIQSGSHDCSHDAGFKTFSESIMTNQTTQGNNAQNPTTKSLFNLIKRTPQGGRVICQYLTFDQAASLINEIPGAFVKFSRMGALS